MKRVVVMAVILFTGWTGVGEAKDRPIEELPRDAWNLVLAWTEPIKQAVKDTRRFDPVSGVWFGLLEGSVKSIERTADYLLPPKESSQPGPTIKSGKALFRYTF